MFFLRNHIFELSIVMVDVQSLQNLSHQDKEIYYGTELKSQKFEEHI
jgi:hypothetical protein